MRGLAVLIFAALFAFVAAAAYGQEATVSACGTPATMSAALAASFGELPAQAGQITGPQAGGVLSIHVNPETRAWTAVVSGFTGRACVIATGERWAAFPREAAQQR